MQSKLSVISTARLVAFILRHRTGIACTALILLLDQAAKLTVMRTIPIWESWPSDGFFRLTHAANYGSTLGLFSGHTVVLIIVSTISIGVLMALHWPRSKTSLRTQVTFALMLAGAAGNLMDRLVFGHVTDFIDVVPWFIFNVADVAIALGFLGFVWDVPGETRRLLGAAER